MSGIRTAAFGVVAVGLGSAVALGPDVLHAEGSPRSSSEPVYAIGRVVASGGNPIRGVEDGILYERRFGAGCQALPGTVPQPFSGSLGDRVDLGIEIAACPSDAPSPKVRCTWRIDPEDEESLSFSGWAHQIQVPMPDRTGSRRFELTCHLPGGGAPSVLEFPLFVTFTKPALFFGEPPERQWFRFATRWGAGFAADAEENAIVRAIQLGMFAYGQRNWRYGYCRAVASGEGVCAFPDGPCLSCRNPSLICAGRACDPDAKCKCSSNAILDPSSPCQFTDCFGFTAALRTLSATMGILGFQNCEICGAFNLGFATQPERRCPDPRFGGNLLCGEDALSCRYLFGNHSLTFRDDELFDATFGAVYEKAVEAVGLSVIRRAGENEILEDQQVACYRASGYGTWPFYDQKKSPDPEILPCPVDPSQPAKIVAGEPPRLRLVEIDGQQKIEVEVEVEIGQKGAYRLFGGLHAGDFPVSLRSDSRFEDAPALAVLRGEPGLRRERLIFSSEDVVEFTRLSPSGSLCGLVTCRQKPTTNVGEIDRLRLTLMSERDLIEERILQLAPQTQTFRETLHGEAPARFAEPPTVRGQGVEPGDDGRFTALRVTARIEVHAAGRYTLYGRLAGGKRTIANAVEILDLEVGEQSVAILFSGSEIANRDHDGEWRVTLELHPLEPPVELDRSTAASIGTFSAGDFG